MLTIINTFAPNARATSYITQLWTHLRKYIDITTEIVRDFNSPLSQVGRTTWLKINKETRELMKR